MKLSELLVDAWSVVPLQAEDLGEALEAVLARVSAEGAVEASRGQNLARELFSGDQGEVVRVNEQVVAVLATLEGLHGPALAVGVSPEPFRLGAEARPEPGSARVLVLVLVPGRLTGARQDIVPGLARSLRDPSRTELLVGVGTVQDVRAIRELMDSEVHPRLLVEDALVPIRYRVYPDTPLGEVVDLMVRRSIHAVPVVGERYEVLGILTSGDALGHLLRTTGRGEDDAKERARAEERTARDFMTRSVLCVSEDQALTEAANMMVNRDVEQLPVVRDGELVGFVTRDSILRALHGILESDETEQEESESSS
jgi:CBS domain-containing protein